MELIQTVLSLIITLGILVTIHEYGHFWVARRCGVKVLRFSVGFGSPIFSWHDRSGTEFAVAAIPLGGYVKMLDEREGEVAAEELHLAFNRQSVYKRIAIAAAGPIANFLFAIFAYWLMFIAGFTVLAPVIGSIEDGSVASKSGLQQSQEIVAVDNEPTRSWQEVNINLLNRLGDSGAITLQVKTPHIDRTSSVDLNVDGWLSGEDMPNPVGALGIHPFRPDIPPILGVVSDDGAAAQAGLKVGDTIRSIDELPIENWMDFVNVIKVSAEKTLTLKVVREGKVKDLILTPKAKSADGGRVIGFIGAGVEPPSWPPEMIREIRYGPLEAVTAAAEKTWSDTAMTLGAIKKMIEGVISVKNLSGPITIARIANTTIQSGLESFLSFLALLSVSLGVLNLLPIPVLDGGHLLYYFVEVLRGKPLSEKHQLFGLKIGITFIVMLMLVAFYNDLARL